MEIINEASARITFPAFDLRPLSQVVLPVVRLLVASDHAGETLTANWRATSSGMDGVASGSLTLDVGTVVKTPLEEVPLSGSFEHEGKTDEA